MLVLGQARREADGIERVELRRRMAGELLLIGARVHGHEGVPVEAVGFEDGLNFRVEWIGSIHCLHDPDFKRTPKNILFPGNKKVRFFAFFPKKRTRHRFHELTRIQKADLI